MSTSSLRRTALLLAAAMPAAIMLGGCTNTINSSNNPSRDHPRDWADYQSLPVDVYGTTPDRSTSRLAGLFPAGPNQHLIADGSASVSDATRRIVLYINPAQLPAPGALCSDSEAFREGPQSGAGAFVAGALCDGAREVSRDTAVIATENQSHRWIRKDFAIVTGQLYQALYPGANQPNYSN